VDNVKTNSLRILIYVLDEPNTSFKCAAMREVYVCPQTVDVFRIVYNLYDVRVTISYVTGDKDIISLALLVHEGTISHSYISSWIICS